jgi:hypothetical protein
MVGMVSPFSRQRTPSGPERFLANDTFYYLRSILDG